ncbi:PREDICTED: thyroid transcription factor 1-associated protein 26 homolog [Ceratosolen solmsi marchali]|uniref:Thyroid transcription factor 1-associated protein 26 homolog n=1 Tax=Ceratosolen solmsi marchali TaxID=326594 RepID=A0AAJ6YHY2_9HYME|nr:PREDICTED: thyroid transcription factor 1-associated protein 26 homolog [Ceratosolen solmsi marchali]
MENRRTMKNNRNNHNNNTNNNQNGKKPFNKKKYREQKYSNKFKVNQWEEKRRKIVLKEFMKDLKNDKDNKIDFSIKNFKNKLDKESCKINRKSKPTWFSIRQDILEKQQKKKEEILKAKQEREEALKQYKQKRMNTYKQLSKKTKKGQPVMSGRIELLLEKIQRSI